MRRNLSIHQHFMPPVSFSTFLQGKNTLQNLYDLLSLNVLTEKIEMLLGGCGGELGVGEGREYQESSDI